MTEKKTTVDGIIGLIDCEPTDSVEEVRKLRGRDTECERLKKENEQLKKDIKDLVNVNALKDEYIRGLRE